MTRGSFLRLQGKGEDEGNVRLRKMGGRKKTKWITLLVWIVLVGALTLLWPAVNSQVANNAPNLPDDSQSVQAAAIAEQEFPSGSGVLSAARMA